MSYCYNAAGQRLPLYERAQEPPDCWTKYENEEEDDRDTIPDRPED